MKTELRVGAVVSLLFGIIVIYSTPTPGMILFGSFLIVLAFILLCVAAFLSGKEKKETKAEQAHQAEEDWLRKEKEARDRRRADELFAMLREKRATFQKEIDTIEKVALTVGSSASPQRLNDRPFLLINDITKTADVPHLFPFVVIDVETTGLDPSVADVIEISAVRFDHNFRPSSCISTLCRPRKPIPYEATEINGITDEMVQGRPLFSEVAKSVQEYIKGCNVVAHNILFDVDFLHVSGVTIDENVRYYDTLKLARNTINEDDVDNYKLETLLDYYQIYRDEEHRALSDSYATAKLFRALISDKLGEDI